MAVFGPSRTKLGAEINPGNWVYGRWEREPPSNGSKRVWTPRRDRPYAWADPRSAHLDCRLLNPSIAVMESQCSCLPTGRGWTCSDASTPPAGDRVPAQTSFAACVTRCRSHDALGGFGAVDATSGRGVPPPRHLVLSGDCAAA